PDRRRAPPSRGRAGRGGARVAAGIARAPTGRARRPAVSAGVEGAPDRAERELDLVARDRERRREPDHALLVERPPDEDAALEAAGDEALGRGGRLELEPDQEAETAHVGQAAATAQLRERPPQLVADLQRALGQALLRRERERRERRRARDRVPAE